MDQLVCVCGWYVCKNVASTCICLWRYVCKNVESAWISWCVYVVGMYVRMWQDLSVCGGMYVRMWRVHVSVGLCMWLVCM